MQPTYNTNENVSVVNNAMIQDSGLSKLVCTFAAEMAKGSRDAMPEELADLFDVKIVTRPSGSRYAVVNFA